MKDPSRLQKLEEYGDKFFPQYMEEIRGIADGSASNLTDILLRNFIYDFPRKGCTTVVFKEKDRIILAHNEDNTKENLGNCYVLQVYPDAGNSFISLCYAGMIPGNSFSFNSNGIAITNNALPTPDIKVGVPRHFIDRHQLEGKSIEDVLKRTLLPERASGGSFNIASSREKRAINVETTSQRYCITEIDEKYLHTNHYISKGFTDLKKDESLLKSSISRYNIGTKLLKKIEQKTPQAALDILSSLETKPYSILRIDKRMSVRTLYTVLFDVSFDGITMKVYEPKPNMQEEDAFLVRTLDDLI
jgi:hypothetical protein